MWRLGGGVAQVVALPVEAPGQRTPPMTPTRRRCDAIATDPVALGRRRRRGRRAATVAAVRPAAARVSGGGFWQRGEDHRRKRVGKGGDIGTSAPMRTLAPVG